MKKSLTGLLGAALISSVCLTGCYGKKETPKPSVPQIPQQRTIYTIENEDGSVIGYFNESNKASLQGLENAGRVEDYRVNPMTGEVYRLTEQKHEVIGLNQTDKPFAETKPQEPEKPTESRYITPEDMDNHYLPEISKAVEGVINERFKAYGFEEIPSEYQQIPSKPQQYQPQSNELPMVPIEPGFPQTQRPRVNVDVDIMSLPPVRSNRR